jgi:hypothetical protein
MWEGTQGVGIISVYATWRVEPVPVIFVGLLNAYASLFALEQGSVFMSKLFKMDMSLMSLLVVASSTCM